MRPSRWQPKKVLSLIIATLSVENLHSINKQSSIEYLFLFWSVTSSLRNCGHSSAALINLYTSSVAFQSTSLIDCTVIRGCCGTLSWRCYDNLSNHDPSNFPFIKFPFLPNFRFVKSPFYQISVFNESPQSWLG